MAANPDHIEMPGGALSYSLASNEIRSYPPLGRGIRIPIQEALKSDEETDPLDRRNYRFNSAEDRFDRASAILQHLEQHGIQYPDKKIIDVYLGVIAGGWRRGDRITPQGAVGTMSRPMPEYGVHIERSSYLDEYTANGGQLLVCGQTLEIRAKQLSAQDLKAALEVSIINEADLNKYSPEPQEARAKPVGAKSEKPRRPSVQARWLSGILSPEDVGKFDDMDAKQREVFANWLAERYGMLAVRGLSQAFQEKRAQQLVAFLTGSSYAEIARQAGSKYNILFRGMQNVGSTIHKQMGKLQIEEILREPGA